MRVRRWLLFLGSLIQIIRQLTGFTASAGSAWGKTLPTLLRTLQALGRAQQLALAGDVVWRA